MTLAHVNLGDPHVQAHNDERDLMNSVQDQVTSILDQVNTTLPDAIAGKLDKAQNLLDLADPDLARANLGAMRAVTPEEYGATGDGVTNDTVPFQAAVDALAALGGGVIHCKPNTTYVIGGLIQKSGVVISCDSSGARMSGNAAITKFIPPAGYTGWIIDSPAGSTQSMGLSGITIVGFYGATGSTHTGGVRWQNCSWGVIANVEVAYTSLGCIKLANGVGCVIRDCTLQNFWQNRPALTQNEATLYVGGTDHVVYGNQCNGGDNTTVYDPVNFYRCGLLLAAWTTWVFEGNGEYADVGVKVTGKLNKLTSVRADVNAGRGIQIDYFGNILSDVTVISNSCAATNTYDGVYLNSLALDTIVDGVVSGDFLGVKHRYVVNDQVSFLGDSDTAQQLPVISNVFAIDQSYGTDLVNHASGMRAMLPPGSSSKNVRPPSRYCHGSTWWDTTDGKLVISDGAHWRDIAGAVVGNLLTPQQANSRGGTVWASGSGYGASILTTIDGWADFKKPQAAQCAWSTGAGACAAQMSALGGPTLVKPGQIYTLVVSTKAILQPADVSFNYVWSDSGGTVIGSLTVGASLGVDSTSAITEFHQTLPAAPAGAAYLYWEIVFTRAGMGAGEAHKIGKAAVIVGTYTSYVNP
jgi:hypothetical protein